MMADVRDRISVTHETHDVRESFLRSFVRYCTYIKRKKDAVAKEKKVSHFNDDFCCCTQKRCDDRHWFVRPCAFDCVMWV
jgi:hypothetical protein